MALTSDAAMVLFYDIAGDTADHDDWHTYEHMHERLSIPGFVRGTRWTAASGTPRYLVIYEMQGVEVGTSGAYLERLNGPTGWTSSMMTRFRGMTRGFCTVVASSGFGLGRSALSMRFTPHAGKEPEALGWLAQQTCPRLSVLQGVASAALFRPALRPPMTKEQSIRGKDADMPWVLVVTGHDEGALERLASDDLAVTAFESHGCGNNVTPGLYRFDYSLTAQEAARSAPRPTLTGGRTRKEADIG